MNKNKKKVVGITAGVVTVFAGWQYFLTLSSEIALFQKYPEIDDKIIIKAHRKMLRDTLLGRGPAGLMDTKDNATMDRVFLNYVNMVKFES